MPSTSKKQHNFMAAIAHSPSFAKKVGVSQSVGKDFTAADKGRKFRTGGRPAAINKQNTQHGSMDMPFKSVRKFAGMKAGGKVKKYAGDTDEGSEVNADTSGDSEYQKYSETKPVEMAPAAAPAAAKHKIVTKEELAKSGISFRDYMNQMQKKTRRGGSEDASGNPRTQAQEDAYVSKMMNFGKARSTNAAQPTSIGNEARRAGMTKATIPLDNEGRRAGRTSAPIPLGNEGRRLGGMKAGGNVKYNFEKSGKDTEKKGMKEGSKAEMALDKKQMPMKSGKPAFMMKKGGMAGYAKGGGIESKGKTKGTVIRMASGGSVSARADGIAQRGKTKFKMC